MPPANCALAQSSQQATAASAVRLEQALLKFSRTQQSLESRWKTADPDAIESTIAAHARMIDDIHAHVDLKGFDLDALKAFRTKNDPYQASSLRGSFITFTSEENYNFRLRGAQRALKRAHLVGELVEHVLEGLLCLQQRVNDLRGMIVEQYSKALVKDGKVVCSLAEIQDLADAGEGEAMNDLCVRLLLRLKHWGG